VKLAAGPWRRAEAAFASSRIAAIRYSEAVQVGQQLAQITGSTIGATPNATDNRANVIRMIEAHTPKAMSEEFSRPCSATSGYKIVGENRVTSVSNRFYEEISSVSGLESGKIADRKMIFRRKFADLPKIWAQSAHATHARRLQHKAWPAAPKAIRKPLLRPALDSCVCRCQYRIYGAQPGAPDAPAATLGGVVGGRGLAAGSWGRTASNEEGGPSPPLRSRRRSQAPATETLRKSIGVFQLGKAEHDEVEIVTTHGIRQRRYR
jgi:hypothetical protein